MYSRFKKETVLRTEYLKPDEVKAQREWYMVDAKDYVLGRLATNVAKILRGKTKPSFSPHQDVGDFVIVVNAEKVQLTGRKAGQKEYFSHSGYTGGEKHISYQRMIENHPERVIEHAVRLMLPKNALGRQMLKKLKVYAGKNHPHSAQNPKPIQF
jgi:large subunit ribosomal protein L13